MDRPAGFGSFRIEAPKTLEAAKAHLLLRPSKLGDPLLLFSPISSIVRIETTISRLRLILLFLHSRPQNTNILFNVFYCRL